MVFSLQFQRQLELKPSPHHVSVAALSGENLVLTQLCNFTFILSRVACFKVSCSTIELFFTHFSACHDMVMIYLTYFVISDVLYLHFKISCKYIFICNGVLLFAGK